MAKTVTKRPTPTDRLVEAHEEIVRLAAENAALKAATGPAPGATPEPPDSPKPKSGGKMKTVIIVVLFLVGLLAGLFSFFMAGLGILRSNWLLESTYFAPTKIELPATPTEEKKTSVEQPTKKLADRLDQPVEEPVKIGEEQILPPPAEEQVVQADQPASQEEALQTYAPSSHDVEVMCGWKAGRAAGMLPEDRANQFARCEQPPVADEPQPVQLAGMYQGQQQQQGRRGCKIPGSVFVREIGACVLHISDPVAVQKIMPDRADDPNCRGKPAGYRYDIQIPPRNGMPAGIAHQVCGVRQ
ncbi:hypothetical protein HYS79_01605 [Patescibacteria group bacterium]|nr:hypothetical protein [Patescibacteria group bacterium]